ncbi:MAG: isoprenylcysteine carboxylmethyltransferase family protein [bacterium]|nr:isoprenylcysteine carboxylmethyltransferase family protein [bacterium]
MAKRGFLERHGVVRNSIRKDLIQFALPALTVFIIELRFCVQDGFENFWGTVWGLIKQPGNLTLLPAQSIMGLALFFTGLTIMLVGQTTLWRNYSGTVLIREDHQLITHGIYRFTRNPIYLGGIMAITGIPVYASSLYGFLSSLVLIPLILNRIRLEERLLTEEFQDAFVRYKETTRRLIPFIY